MRKLFTKEQEDYIRSNYDKISYADIARYLSVTEQQINGWVHNHIKNKKDKRERYTEQDEMFIRENYRNMTYGEIAKTLNKTEKTVRDKAERMGLVKAREFNKNYFHNIDSDIKAYLLGFIFADGWVVYNKGFGNYEFGIELKSEDKYILDCINNEIGGVHCITHSNPTIRIIKGNIANCGHEDRLRIYSKDIVEDLISHGVVPNKTHNYSLPIFSMEYFFDFLRGYIDGDGCYYVNDNSILMSLVCADKSILEWIKCVLSVYGISTSIYTEYELKHSLRCYDSESMKKLISLLYHDNFSLCLTRKYNKIKSFYGLP